MDLELLDHLGKLIFTSAGAAGIYFSVVHIRRSIVEWFSKPSMNESEIKEIRTIWDLVMLDAISELQFMQQKAEKELKRLDPSEHEKFKQNFKKQITSRISTYENAILSSKKKTAKEWYALVEKYSKNPEIKSRKILLEKNIEKISNGQDFDIMFDLPLEMNPIVHLALYKSTMAFSLFLYSKKAEKILLQNGKISTSDIQVIRSKCQTKKKLHRDNLFKMNKITIPPNEDSIIILNKGIYMYGSNPNFAEEFREVGTTYEKLNHLIFSGKIPEEVKKDPRNSRPNELDNFWSLMYRQYGSQPTPKLDMPQATNVPSLVKIVEDNSTKYSKNEGSSFTEINSQINPSNVQSPVKPIA